MKCPLDPYIKLRSLKHLNLERSTLACHAISFYHYYPTLCDKPPYWETRHSRDTASLLTSLLTLTFVSDPCELDALEAATVTSPSSLLLLASFPSAGSNDDCNKRDKHQQQTKQADSQ